MKNIFFKTTSPESQRLEEELRNSDLDYITVYSSLIDTPTLLLNLISCLDYVGEKKILEYLKARKG